MMQTGRPKGVSRRVRYGFSSSGSMGHGFDSGSDELVSTGLDIWT
jgi:hypothetical protein